MSRRFYTAILIFTVLILANGGLLFYMAPTNPWISQQWERFQNRGKRGFVSREFIDAQGEPHKYVVFVPYQLRSKTKHPLILFLHGAGERGDDGTNPLVAGIGSAIWESKRQFPFVVLFPQEPPQTPSYSKEKFYQNVIQMLDFTIDEYNVDPDRISVTGISRGGDQSWEIVDAYPDRFAATCPISANCSPQLMKQVAQTQTSIWNVYVRGDSHKLGQQYREQFAELLKLGYSPRFTEIDGTLSDQWWHHNAWDYATRNKAFINWLLQQNRSKNLSKKPFQLISPDSKSSRWQFNQSVWSISQEGTFNFLDSTPATSIPATYKNEYQNYELHLEFKVNQGNGCSLQFYDTKDPGYLKLDVVPPENGSGGAFEYPEEKFVSSSNCIAQHAYVPHEWNDLRIRVTNSLMNVQLNGWELYSLRGENCTKLNGNFALSVPDPETGNVQWRYLRIREID